LPIAEDKWVAVSLEFPNEKDFWFLGKKFHIWLWFKVLLENLMLNVCCLK
jgi:hypothetical protein